MLNNVNCIDAKESFKRLVAGNISKEETEQLLTNLTGMESYDIPSNKEMDECEESLIQNPQANL